MRRHTRPVLTLTALVIGAGLVPSASAEPPDVDLLEVASMMASGVDDLTAIDTPLAVWGNLAVIGDPAHGDRDDPGSGMVFVYRHTGLDWSRVARLVAPDGEGGDHFGASVAIDGDTIVVGAPGDDDAGRDAGAVYVFRKVDRSWIEDAKLMEGKSAASDHTRRSDSPEVSDHLRSNGMRVPIGAAVAVSGDTILVGSSQDDAEGLHLGPVLVFRSDGTRWVEQRHLIESPASHRPSTHGLSLALQGQTAAIGMYPLNASDQQHGVVHVFEYRRDNWNPLATLESAAPIAGEQFARLVALGDSMIAVGATDRDEQGQSTGSVYVFRRDGQRWSQEARLVPTFPFPGERIGFLEVISPNTVVTGSRWAEDGKIKSGVGKVFGFKHNEWAEDAGTVMVVTTRQEMKQNHEGQ